MLLEKELTIRLYLPEEELGREFFELANRSFANGSPWTLQQYADTLADKQLMFLVADLEGSIIGYDGGKRLLDEAEIYSVAVDPEFQHRQVATELVRAFMADCHYKGADVVFLEVRESNLPARAFYEKLNFKDVGRRTKYYTHPIEDAILMKCNSGKLDQNEQ